MSRGVELDVHRDAHGLVPDLAGTLGGRDAERLLQHHVAAPETVQRQVLNRGDALLDELDVRGLDDRLQEATGHVRAAVASPRGRREYVVNRLREPSPCLPLAQLIDECRSQGHRAHTGLGLAHLHDELTAGQVDVAPGERECLGYPQPCACEKCHDPAVYDYDCASGSGDGPGYVYGTVRVVGYDEYGLDGNGNGYGCE
jgi:hypothetical protein